MADTGVVADDEFVVDESRRKLLIAATAATGAIGAGFVAAPFIASWTPSERAQALGLPTELDLAQLEPGQMTVTVWRKQPIYVVHRTAEMLATLGAAALRGEWRALAQGRVSRAHRHVHASRLPAQGSLRAA
jgi:ubiquinol-cytochrome c reductase iron-sulfur subunit